MPLCLSPFGLLFTHPLYRLQVCREFAIVIISCLAQADPLAARGLALQPSCISQLIAVLESAESAAFSIAQQRGVAALRENPEAMGTSLDMIRRTSATLVEMALVEDNQPILLKQQDRLLGLVMSQILDQHVAKMISDVLYECTKKLSVNLSPSYIRKPKDSATQQREDDSSEPQCSSGSGGGHKSSGQGPAEYVSRKQATSNDEVNKENIDMASLGTGSMEVLSTVS